MPSRLFVDTSAYVALARPNDEHHQEALAVAQKLRRQRARLYMTNFVVAETHALLLRYLGASAARSFLREVDKGAVAIVVRADPTDEELAKTLIYHHIDKEYSLVDAISFVVMERLRLKQAFAFDKHFAQYGWQIPTP
jgi:uncharacterized protein